MQIVKSQIHAISSLRKCKNMNLLQRNGRFTHLPRISLLDSKFHFVI